MAPRQTTLDPSLIHELREAACQGATTRQLIDKVRGDFEAAESVIPILAYLRRAFFVPLPIILPLREDLGTGAFGNAIQVLFWFAALLTRDVDVEPWDWDRFWRKFPCKFSARDLEHLPTDVGDIGFTRTSNSPGDLYARVVYEVYVDKCGAFGPCGGEVYEQIRQLAAAFRDLIAQSVAGDSGNGLSMQIKFDYQIAEQGPKLHVVCMAEALREANVPLGEPAVSAR